MMKKLLVFLCAMLLIFGMAGMAHTALITIGTATYGGTDYNLIWDDDNNGNSVVWLDYSHQHDTWSNQVNWASSLNGVLTYNFASAYTVDWGTNFWRLPTTVTPPQTIGGYNITNSEIGHLFYTELGNLGYLDTDGTFQPGYGLQNTEDFENLISDAYWSGTAYYDSPFQAWFFSMNSTGQHFYSKSGSFYGLAVRSGQVFAAAPVPEPATMLLFGTGLIGLAGFRRKVKK